jgi:predicted AlkP superfamily pyrophosphatase or phosphodiesterase
MKAAMESIDEGYDLVFIHFHGIDDRGHEFGPYHRNTLEYVEVVEDYLIELDSVWEGAIIATADHGMIETEDGGDHGSCQYEDMIVPYFLREPSL